VRKRRELGSFKALGAPYTVSFLLRDEVARIAGTHGLMISTPSKSLSLSVTTTQSFASAIAAMMVVKGAAGAATRFAVRHGPGETRFFIEGRHSTGKQRLRALRTGEPRLKFAPTFTRRLLKHATKNFSNGRGGDVEGTAINCPGDEVVSRRCLADRSLPVSARIPPRQEIAGSWHRTVQGTLWGIGQGQWVVKSRALLVDL
jgi:hypothetical protein